MRYMNMQFARSQGTYSFPEAEEANRQAGLRPILATCVAAARNWMECIANGRVFLLARPRNEKLELLDRIFKDGKNWVSFSRQSSSSSSTLSSVQERGGQSVSQSVSQSDRYRLFADRAIYRRKTQQEEKKFGRLWCQG
jgi:hypothetical protein